MENTNLDNVKLNNEKLEEAMEVYVKEQNKENLTAVLNLIRNAHLFVPAVFPKDMDMSLLQGMEQGEKINLPENIHPIPTILKNQQGDQYLPVYTKKEEIPKEQKFQTLLEVTFRSSYLTVLNQDGTMNGLALNPFHENILIKKPLLEKLKEQDDKLENAKKMVKLTPEQYHGLVRRNIELKTLPHMLFEQGERLTEQLCVDKEKLIATFYQKSYPQNQPCPYGKDDFSFMALNIREDLLLIRIDLPEKNLTPGLCHRVYMTWNSKLNQAGYFTIEKTPEKETRQLGRVDQAGNRIDYGVAPVEGAEIQRILDILDEERIGAN